MNERTGGRGYVVFCGKGYDDSAFSFVFKWRPHTHQHERTIVILFIVH
jgi:hypothetical protein